MINSFPGYEFVYSGDDKKWHNLYRGIDVGFGGLVYAEPGMYGNVALLDVRSMHPTSIINLNYFGEYTKNFKELLEARIAIKQKDIETAKTMFGGRLTKYLTDKDSLNALSYALKIVLNSQYGLTSSSYDVPSRDPRNKNNIVALRGALFMKTLQDEVVKQGFVVAHIKTDSIKIPDATPDIIKFCMDFAEEYGYTFEHEDTYDRMCLVNDAVYIAKYKKAHMDKKTGKEIWWSATGTQFQVPYVFKKLFSKEDILFEDLCETKSVTSALYLDLNEQLIENEHDYHFVGKVGQFCPMKEGTGGGLLLRLAVDANTKEKKYVSAVGSKGYRWLESEVVKNLGKEKDIDRSYYDRMVDEAVKTISEYGDFEWFVSDDPYVAPPYFNGKPI